MNNKLNQFMSFLGFNEDEIVELIERCPGLQVRNVDNIINSTLVLTSCGFPRSELHSLITINPNFLLGEPEHIKKVVSTIKGDIVKTLFENPYII